MDIMGLYIMNKTHTNTHISYHCVAIYLCTLISSDQCGGMVVDGMVDVPHIDFKSMGVNNYAFFLTLLMSWAFCTSSRGTNTYNAK